MISFNKKNRKIVVESFNYLIQDFGFELIKIRSEEGALYANFISNKVEIKFLYEYRDFIPDVLFSLGNDISQEDFRVGLYTLKELYSDPNFVLKSFYISEIIKYKKGSDVYGNYFKGISTIKEIIDICACCVKNECSEFIKGDEKSYQEINRWFKNLILT